MGRNLQRPLHRLTPFRVVRWVVQSTGRCRRGVRPPRGTVDIGQRKGADGAYQTSYNLVTSAPYPLQVLPRTSTSRFSTSAPHMTISSRSQTSILTRRESETTVISATSCLTVHIRSRRPIYANSCGRLSNNIYPTINNSTNRRHHLQQQQQQLPYRRTHSNSPRGTCTIFFRRVFTGRWTAKSATGRSATSAPHYRGAEEHLVLLRTAPSSLEAFSVHVWVLFA